VPCVELVASSPGEVTPRNHVLSVPVLTCRTPHPSCAIKARRGSLGAHHPCGNRSRHANPVSLR
jgi:hypothetical protein